MLMDWLKAKFGRDPYANVRLGRESLPQDAAGALAYFARAAELAPENGMLHFHIAETLCNFTATQPALQTPALKFLSQAVARLEPTHPFRSSAYWMRGNIQCRMLLFAEAIDDYKHALEDNSHPFETYYRRGLVYWKCNEWTAAERDFVAALASGIPDPLVMEYEAALSFIRERLPIAKTKFDVAFRR